MNPTDEFSYNVGFTDAKMRIKINQIQLKETKEENKTTHERVAADRHYETQAAIVRIMKSRKTIKHSELIAEVIEATRSRGTLQPADIKLNIEKYSLPIFPSNSKDMLTVSSFSLIVQIDRKRLHGACGRQFVQLRGIDRDQKTIANLFFPSISLRFSICINIGIGTASRGWSSA